MCGNLYLQNIYLVATLYFGRILVRVATQLKLLFRSKPSFWHTFTIHYNLHTFCTVKQAILINLIILYLCTVCLLVFVKYVS